MPDISTPPPSSKRNIYVFGVTSFLNDTASEMAYWLLPAFLASIGAGPAQLGLIEGIAESMASFAKLFSGYMTDRLDRRKPMVVFGYAVANIAKPILAVVNWWWQVLAIRFADRTAKGIRGAPRDVLLAESVPKSEFGAAFGLMQAMDSAGAVAGPLAALLLVSHIGIRGVFLAAAVPGFLSIAAITIFARESANRPPRDPALAKPKFSLFDGPALPPAFYYTLGAVLLFSVGNSSDMFLILRAQNIGIAPHYAPLLGLIFNITFTAASWPAGSLGDRIPKTTVAAMGYLVFTATYLTFAAAPSATALWIAMAVYGLYYALTSPVLRASVMETVPAESRGRANGIFYFTTSIATLLASVLTGQLWKHMGPALPFYLSAGLAAIAAIMLLLASKPQMKPKTVAA